MQKTKFPAVVATFIVCFAFWVLLTWSFTMQELIAGGVVSLAVALFAARFFIHEKAFWFFNPLKFFSGLFYWVCIFPVELIKANVDMAKRCFGGCKNINPGIVKVGAAIHDDVRGLQKYAGFKPQNFVDLQNIVWEYGIRDKSVKKMAAIILGVKISKAQQLSNWEAETLSGSQLRYAATDAWVCREMYLRLLRSPKHPLTPEQLHPERNLDSHG